MNLLAAQSAAQAPEPFSVSAAVSLQERRYRTIKCGDTFGVFDHGGDILSVLGGVDVSRKAKLLPTLISGSSVICTKS